MSVAEKLPPPMPRLMAVDEFLARPSDGTGMIILASLGFETPLAEVYVNTHLAAGQT